MSNEHYSLSERWAEIPSCPGYEISDAGRLRSPRGIKKLWRQPRGGYLFASFKKINGKRRVRAIHRLVLEAFVGPCPQGCQAAHFDGNPANNRLSNLRWTTPKENIGQDRARHGRTARRERNGRAVLDTKEVEAIRAEYIPGLVRMVDLAKKYGVVVQTISDIVNRNHWS